MMRRFYAVPTWLLHHGPEYAAWLSRRGASARYCRKVAEADGETLIEVWVEL